MQRITTMTVLLAAMVLAAGCGKKGTEAADPHAGHDHGAGEHGEAQVAEAAFCEEHQIAEAECAWCNPQLVDDLGFCAGHGVPEAFCYQCNPRLIPGFKAAGDWCAGHDRPESQCYLCNPELAPGAPAQGASADHGVGGWTSAQPRSNKPPAVLCQTANSVIRFENANVVGEAGLQIVEVGVRPISKSIECNASIAYDGNRHAHLSAQIPGVISAVHKQLGDRVEPGDALATVTASQLGGAKAAYLHAIAANELWERNFDRESDLQKRGVATERDLLEAETRVTESRISLSQARQNLLSLGLTEQQIEMVAKSNDTSSQYVINASLGGIVVQRHASVGELVDPAAPIFTVADVSTMWAMLEIYESDLRDVSIGNPVVLQVEGLPGESFGAYVTWVSSELNPRTRTLQARAELDNPDGLLRANMFAVAGVTVREREGALVVPKEAVQWEGCCNVVFVQVSETEFHPVKVHLGVETGNYFEVLSGLDPFERVVTQGSFLLKTELLKGSIGSGCCEVQPGS